MMLRFALAILLALLAVSAGAAEDQRLYGAWKPTVYTIGGIDHPMDGLIIITPKYFSANTLFALDEDSAGDANANAGPYELVDGKIVITQWMQLHWRPGSPDENFLTQGVVEEIPYTIENDHLIFLFPSGNKYIAERLRD